MIKFNKNRKINTENNEKVKEAIKEILKLKNLKLVEKVVNMKTTLNYSSGVDRKPNLARGQRKLFLGELWALLKSIKKDESALVIYPGGAPGSSIGMLSKLFPQVKFLLIDPNEFDVRLNVGGKVIHHYNEVKKNDPSVIYVQARPLNMYKINDRKIYQLDDKLKLQYDDIKNAKQQNINWNSVIEYISKSPTSIFAYQDYMTESLAKKLSQIELTCFDKVLLWSDIRTFINKDQLAPEDPDLISNMAMQEVWRQIISPDVSWFKFRFPFRKGKFVPVNKEAERSVIKCLDYGIDFVKNYKEGKLFYPQGDLYLQAWNGHNSTETRLLIWKGAEIVNYHNIIPNYDDVLFDWNNVERPYGHHLNEKSNEKYGFDHCGNCAIEAMVWDEYEAQYGKYSTWLEDMTLVFYTLKRDGHGTLFNPLTIKEVTEMKKSSKYYTE